MLKNYFKVAFRNLIKHRTTAFINIAGLTVGITAAVFIMLWVQNEYSFDNYHKDVDNIYRIKTKLTLTKTEVWDWESSPYLLGPAAKQEIPGIKNYTFLWPGYMITVHHDNQLITEKKYAFIDANWFKVFHYDFVAGSAESFSKNPFSLILTQSTAKKYFGDGEAVGKTLRVDSMNYQVQAVVKDNPANSSFQYDMLIPVEAKLSNPHEKQQSAEWGNYSGLTFLKLQPGINVKDVGKKLTDIIRKNNKGSENTTMSVIGLREMHFETGLLSTSFEKGNLKLVNIFLILAFLLVATACINYVNLTTARSSVRAKEVSVRKIVGAGRGQLFGQFMSESLVVSFLALSFAILFIQLCLPWFNEVTEKHFVQPLASVTTWLLLLGTLVVCFVFNGLYPAILLSSFKPLTAFKGRAVLNFKDGAIRKTLVVLQFAISVMLIISTMIIYRQLNFVQKADLGYNREHVFVMSIPWQVLGFDDKVREPKLRSIMNELKQQSAIGEVSRSANDAFFNNSNKVSGSMDWEGRPDDYKPSVATISADENFQHILGLKMQDGHWFSKTGSDQHNVILNETAVKQLGIHQPVIGQRFKFNGDSGVVAGVVKDFNFRSLHEKIGPMVINNHTDWARSFYIKTTPGNTAAAIKIAQNVWNKFVPEQPFEYSFIDDGYNKLYHAEQRSSTLIASFATIAIVISAMGLLGLVAFAAEQRVKEIGIRKVLGASVQSIIRLLSADFLKTVLIANLIAFPVAWYMMNKWLQDFAYRINISWWIFAVAAIVALLVALLTVSIQSIKAALANPARSLRSGD
ncbi:ABC transporter permease [Mucilaginibacter celer]|uniref:FtsX-like permease family protein n=1 Tax=Mucilaginibacter celer TaxID=2305508 RepID=A0A494VP16_9SPHI|nr:ABC transporter permease [Mucilaginibacter celer]AYL94840.1 FtsX-like permease family protein [Mucilaginibacter celer]